MSARARLLATVAAIKSLDTQTDDHWTNAGLPHMDHLKEATGFPDLTRSEVSAIAPDYTREKRYEIKVPDDHGDAQEPATTDDGTKPGQPTKDAGANAGTGDDEAKTTQEGEAQQNGNDTAPTQEKREITAAEIAKHVPDALVLIEAAVLASSAERYQRNGALQTFIRHFHVDQVNIREHQKRIDERQAQRDKQRADAAS